MPNYDEILDWSKPKTCREVDLDISEDAESLDEE